MRTAFLAALLWALGTTLAAAQERPIVDAHIHYSHDTWDTVPPPEAVAVLRKAGVKKSFVSSSNDDGTRINPDLIPMPGLCLTCKSYDAKGQEMMLCILNRNDQKDDEGEFQCEAYEPQM